VLNDKWTLERLIGVGGMAAVYAARHRNGAKAAVKVLHPDLSRHKEVRERFLREGYAANRVEHPGAVKVMDDDVVAAGPDAGTAYLVMELLEGESLQDRLERGASIGEREFLAIAEMVLDVLDAAHSRGVVHRDLKPENLFLVLDAGSGQERVKVLDFGLARLLDGQAITTYGLALGTPSFMSPEQAAGRIDEIDGRTDLFALAATGFRLRTGRRIHEGANAIELVRKMANFAAPKIQTMAPDVSSPFARVIDRALEFKREDRYGSAAEMRADVRRALGQLDGLARTELAVVSPLSAPQPPPSPEPTMEVSEREIEWSAPSARPREEGPKPPAPAAPVEAAKRPSASDGLPVLRSARPPARRRRSIMPWLTLVLFGGIGAKLWLDARSHAASPPSATAAASTAPPTAVSAPASASAGPLAVASATAPPSASASASAAQPAAARAPAPAHTTTSPHHAKPPRPGPGTVHHLVEPRRHRRTSTKSRQ